MPPRVKAPPACLLQQAEAPEVEHPAPDAAASAAPAPDAGPKPVPAVAAPGPDAAAAPGPSPAPAPDAPAAAAPAPDDPAASEISSDVSVESWGIFGRAPDPNPAPAAAAPAPDAGKAKQADEEAGLKQFTKQRKGIAIQQVCDDKNSTQSLLLSMCVKRVLNMNVHLCYINE